MARKIKEVINDSPPENIDPLLSDAERDFTEINEESEINAASNNKLIDLINAINNVLFGREIEQKTKLSQKNIIGIVKGETFCRYIKETYGYTFVSIPTVIQSKRLHNKSHNGYAFEKAVESMKNLSPSLEIIEGRRGDLNDRLAGVRK